MLVSIKRSCGYEPHGLPLPQSAEVAGYYGVLSISKFLDCCKYPRQVLLRIELRSRASKARVLTITP